VTTKPHFKCTCAHCVSEADQLAARFGEAVGFKLWARCCEIPPRW
jgi:hypothetical protein